MANYYTDKNLKAFKDARNAFRVQIENGEKIIVSISHGNSKMGEIPSVSLLPYITCPFKCADCYAAKIAALYPTVRNAYARNTALAQADLVEYMRQVENAAKMTRFFRWHVSGDITTAAYFAEMVRIAEDLPHTEFLAFTKRYNIVNAFIENGGTIPENLHIIFSEWDGVEMPNPYNLPTAAVVRPGCEPADDWKICGGNCFECACRGVGCWELKKGETIAFNLH